MSGRRIGCLKARGCRGCIARGRPERSEGTVEVYGRGRRKSHSVGRLGTLRRGRNAERRTALEVGAA